MESQPAVGGTMPQQHHLQQLQHELQQPLLSFPTRTPPYVASNTHILAAVHANLDEAFPKKDGWFIADFYAFNLLFKGYGRSQTWLTAVAPEDIVEEYGQLTHGNPYEDRKVVIDENIVNNGEFTPVTVVNQEDLVDRFIEEVTRVSKTAKETNGNVLLLIFCHNIGAQVLALGGSNSDDKSLLSIGRVQAALESDVTVRLVTTACHSSGWTLSPNINIDADIDITTAMEETEETEESAKPSMSWPEAENIGQFSGSIFAKSIIGSLSAESSELTRDDESQGPLTYKAFCDSVWRSCRASNWLWNERSFTFPLHNHGWILLIEEFERRYSELKTHPYKRCAEKIGDVDSSQDNILFAPPDRRRIAEMIRLWRIACPGDKNAAYWRTLNNFMNQCAEQGTLTVKEGGMAANFNLADMIEYRPNMSQLAEHILWKLGLPRPGNKSCLSWSPYEWDMATDAAHGRADIFELEQDMSRIWTRMETLGITSRTQPMPSQGPIFARFDRYILAAIIEARIPSTEDDREEEERALHAILEHIDQAEQFYKDKVGADPGVKLALSKHFGQPSVDPTDCVLIRFDFDFS